ncbi:hypothetical protein Tco_1091913 [Tanacetum coccineum]|uniref:Uncharacterized protein n=1 Tax=Tanacetum coccineum TaxID=301880 RepID=A0ABQ5I8E2_9ASTR
MNKGKEKKKVEDDDEDFIVEEQKDGGNEKTFNSLRRKMIVKPLYDATYQHAFDRETLEMHAVQFGLGEVIEESDEENANETEIRETKIRREAKFQSVLKEKRELEDLLKENMEMDELFKEDKVYGFVKEYENFEHERMILESVEHYPLIWPTVEENRVTKIKKYAELSDAEKIQADGDMKATNIIPQGFAVPVVCLVDDPIACLNMAIAFLIVVAFSRFPSTNNQLRTSLNLRNHATIQDGRVTVQQV